MPSRYGMDGGCLVYRFGIAPNVDHHIAITIMHFALTAVRRWTRGTVTMGQLRRLKRQFERDSRKKSMKELYEHCDRVSEQQERELREEYKKAAIDQDVKNMTYAMYYLFGVHLHDDFGFGGKRLLRLFESVDKEIATWASGGITTGQLQQKLFDTTGIDLRLDGIDFRKETA